MGLSSDWDLAVIGSGIVGLASAYHIARSNPEIKIIVVDKGKTFGQGNTGKSGGAFRDLFAGDINYKLASSSIQFYKHIQNELKVNLGMHFNGYLFLMDQTTDEDRLFEQLMEKVKSRFLTKDELLTLSESLKFDPDIEEGRLMKLKKIERGFFCENCGIFEPELIAKFYYESLLRLGVKVMFNTRVKQIEFSAVKPIEYPGEPFIWQDLFVKSLKTDKGEIHAVRYLVATDVWTTYLLEKTGIDSHIRPQKKQIFQVSGPPIAKLVNTSFVKGEQVMPYIILPSYGVHLRPVPGSDSIWVGAVESYGRDFSLEEDPNAEFYFYQNNLFPILNAYVKGIKYTKLTGSWAGYYSYNTLDFTPYVFADHNIIVATGTSGSGIMKGDAIGRVVAALYNGEEDTELYGGIRLRTSLLGIDERCIAKEKLIL